VPVTPAQGPVPLVSAAAAMIASRTTVSP
jgi:hypothetical protein